MRVIIEDDATDSIPGIENTKRSDCSSLSGGNRLHVELRAEEHRHALVDDEQGGAIALFRKYAYMRPAGTRRGLPVDRSNVIAGQVVTHFFKIQATATQAGRVATV